MGHLDAQKDAGFFYSSLIGVTGSSASFSNISGSYSAITDAPTSGQYLVVTDVLVSAGVAMTLELAEETSNKLLFKVFMPANGTAQYTPRGKNKLSAADKRLVARSNAVGNVAFTVTHYSEA